MDVNVNEDSLEQVTNLLAEYPDQLNQLRATVVEAKQAVDDIGSGSFFSDYSTSVDRCLQTSEVLEDSIIKSLGLLKVSRSFESGETTTIYDSFHGEQNSPAVEFFKNLLNGFTKKGSDAAEKHMTGDDTRIDKFNKGMEKKLEDKNKDATSWKEKQEERFKNWAGDNYNEKYKFGKTWKYGTFDLFKKKLWDFSGELWGKEGSVSGKYGTLDGSVRVGAADTSATFSVGPDHVKLDASASIDGFKAEGSYKTPALTTKDGLEVISAGGGVEISALHAEAKAKAGFGRYVDEKTGEKKFEAGVQLKAEADLVKAEAKGQVTVAGVTAEGSLGVKVGVGAQFDAGFTGSKLNFNLSLAAGIGIEVGFSLDFGKVTDYVTDKVSGFGKKAASFFGF